MGIYRHFPYTNFHEMNLDQIINIVNETVEEWVRYRSEWETWQMTTESALEDLKRYVDTKFGDVADVVTNVIEDMYEDGRLTTLITNAYPDIMPLSYKSSNYRTFENLINMSWETVYDYFDEYVDSGMLSRTVIGYATLPTPIDVQGEADITKPIYMYSWSRPATYMGGFVTSRFNGPILLTSAIHGPEKLGIPAILTMLNDYENHNPVVTKIFNEHDIDIIPVLNPVGFNESIGTTVATVEENIGRTNARGVDLNRNGETLWYSADTAQGTFNYKGSAPYSECEMVALQTAYSARTYALVIDLHTERYNDDINIFGKLYNPSSIVRSLFCNTIEQLYDRITDYGFNIPAETNTFGITGNISATPQWINDYNFAHNSDVFASILEFPRYNVIDDVKVIYPEVIQKISTDILINFINNAIATITQHEQNISIIFESAKRLTAFSDSIYPVLPSQMRYGVINETGDYPDSSNTRLYNPTPINVSRGTYKIQIINLLSAPIQVMIYAYNSEDPTDRIVTSWSGSRELTIASDTVNKLHISMRRGTSPDWLYIDRNSYGRDFQILVSKIS